MNAKNVQTLITAVMALCLAACGLSPAPTSLSPGSPGLDEGEPAAATLVPSPTATPAFTPTPLPTNTATPLPPTATPPPTLTPTPLPSPTITHTPRPTATPTLAPGDVMFEPDFDDLSDWMDFGFSWNTAAKTTNYTVETRKTALYLEVPEKTTSVYAIYAKDMPKSDVQIDVDTDTTGPDRNNISLVCRLSDEGWYELSVDSSGLWAIYRYDVKVDYTMLNSGGSTAIHMIQRQNHITALCRGDTFTLFVNDVKVGSAKDKRYTQGRVGVGVSTFTYGGTGIRFTNLKVRLPDPDHLPGGKVAPTVLPVSTKQAPKHKYASYPLAGSSVATPGLQAGAMILAAAYIVPVDPECPDYSDVNTEFMQITQPVAFDEQDHMTAGQWVERWTINFCGKQVILRVTFTANSTGMINYDVKPW